MADEMLPASDDAVPAHPTKPESASVNGNEGNISTDSLQSTSGNGSERKRKKWPSDESTVAEMMLKVAKVWLDMDLSIIEGAKTAQWEALLRVLEIDDLFFKGIYWKTISSKFEEYVNKFKKQMRPCSGGLGNASGNARQSYGEREQVQTSMIRCWRCSECTLTYHIHWECAIPI
ncbi:hypothetical protein GUITHDRAFT_140442 [Guillardia theta CCMP2712]|uniref:Uncharacterized protein n=1 Tax=Guillardia theta (strain CCMP2712) TaxID=905079 RepID=L1J4D3_GUITC|nr:hypothetical protein GUITHDRAFT_140442 [Guillardia theta CCMP2712]EKX43383.1 hypothetical protein GUITHDRAFT_140442 [Guillardia theta CCMP2712]|eukprot:XP_005830363.1 hypothetical protein GUITHDRAFT_140442 [Guillardia theta CCMP2712]